MLAATISAGNPAVADVSPPPAAAAAAADPFYSPQEPLPAGRPGDVIRWRPSTIGSLFGVLTPAKATAYQIMYRSTDDAGIPIAITGTVLLPMGRNPATLPIVGYAPSTHGIADTCSASQELVAGTDTDLININDALVAPRVIRCLIR